MEHNKTAEFEKNEYQPDKSGLFIQLSLSWDSPIESIIKSSGTDVCIQIE